MWNGIYHIPIATDMANCPCQSTKANANDANNIHFWSNKSGIHSANVSGAILLTRSNH